MALAGNDKGVPVGALTSENRDVWTEVGPCVLFDHARTLMFT